MAMDTYFKLPGCSIVGSSIECTFVECELRLREIPGDLGASNVSAKRWQPNFKRQHRLYDATCNCLSNLYHMFVK